MKTKLLLWVVLASLPFTAWGAGENAQCRSTTAGLKCGENAAAKIGFHGATPVAQQTGADMTAFNVLQTIGHIDSTAVDYSVQHRTVSLTAANLLAMYATPVVILPAQGAGKSIIVSKLAFSITRTSTAFANGGAVIFQYGTTANGAGTQALDSTLASTVITGAAGTSISFRNGAVVSDSAAATTQNVGLYISNQTAAFITGTGTATVDVWYLVR